MRARVRDRLPEFTVEEMKIMKGSFDFIGFNYYGAIYTFNKANASRISYATDAEFDMTGSLCPRTSIVLEINVDAFTVSRL